ncbi:hypothetical protein [Variovorax paradoxus]|uniref:Uncharacterized protein n=1 Tax=Variovorax paradoxus TaxID=34073 RepID=A0A679JIG9_VARPD|nr:hypothetical protein VVAX_03567 [Variovorax paradoxus]
MSFILAIDPGTTQSGWVIYGDGRVHDSGVMPNREMVTWLATREDSGVRLAIEMIASYGMAVGREVFETCVWIGRFKQAWHSPDTVQLVYRKDVKLHLCGTTKAKDPNVRQALIDLFPAVGGGKTPQIGTKSQPGPLYGVSSHAWPALGVAVTVGERERPAPAIAAASVVVFAPIPEGLPF